MKDLMIDLETLGTTPRAVVISLGACFFDIEKNALGPMFYAKLEVDDQLRAGRVIDAETLRWWMNQSDAAKKIFSGDDLMTAPVLLRFKAWVKETTNFSQVRPWGNGSTFDISIMEDLFSQNKMLCPWVFYNVMDLRTFRRFVGKNEKVERIGTHHNALDDAKSQALYVLKHAKGMK